MADTEKLRRDIDTLREVIRLDWFDLASRPVSAEERQQTRVHIQHCIRDLADLLVRLEAPDA
jgi:hypothetical protein